MSGARLSVKYSENSRLYRVQSAVDLTTYPPGRTLLQEQVDELIRRGVRVTITSATPPKKTDPWESLLRSRKKR